MYRNTQTNWHPQGVDYNYVVYFYQSGRFERYLQHQRDIFAGLNYPLRTIYDFSSDLIAQGRYRRPQTVEDVVRNGYLSIPKSEPEMAIITDKKHTSKLGLDDIIGQIRNRFEVYQRNLYELEVSKCSAINRLFEYRAYHGATTSRVEYSVNKRMDRLYSEQREQRVDLWRDISRLRVLLPETAQKYLASYRKVSILEDKKGDEP